MDNLHAPTVPSGDTTRPLANGNAAHLSFAELQAKKDDVEAELKALSGVLDSVSQRKRVWTECACWQPRIADVRHARSSTEST